MQAPALPARYEAQRSYQHQSTERHTALPDVFVVGAAKSGTTALYQYFKLHPQAYVPIIKETNFMAFCQGRPAYRGPGDESISRETSATSLAEYKSLYRNWRHESVAVDVSPSYLHYHQAAPKIAELCPDAKIVIVLRNPVERAFSMYSMLRRDRRETRRTFRDAFELTPQRLKAGWSGAWDYQGAYLFSQQVARYLKLFSPSQLFIRRYEQLKLQPAQFYAQLCDFLEIEPIDVHQANRNVNVGATRRDIIRTRKLGRWMLRAASAAGCFCPKSLKTTLRRRFLEGPAFELSPVDRQMLVEHFEGDIRKLAALLRWNLNEWLET